MRLGINKMKEIFKEDSKFKVFLLSILITSLGYGLYKGMLDNYLAEIVMMGEMDRGITEFFRELPGVMLVFILAAFYMLSAEALYKVGAVIMLIGMGMQTLIPPHKVLVILAICIFSLGEHIQLGMKNTLSLQYAKPGRGGEALGAQNASAQIGTLVGYGVIVVVFSLLSGEGVYKFFFMIAAILMGISAICALKITGKSETDKSKSRFYFHKKYTKYYMLEMFYGARKQVFFTFGPYVFVFILLISYSNTSRN